MASQFLAAASRKRKMAGGDDPTARSMRAAPPQAPPTINFPVLQPQPAPPPPPPTITFPGIQQPQQAPPPMGFSAYANAFNSLNRARSNRPNTPTAASLVELAMSTPVRSYVELLTKDDEDDPLKRHMDEVKQLIQSHNDNLRSTLSDATWKYCMELLRLAEERAARRVADKEVELRRVSSKGVMLEEKVSKLKMELQIMRSDFTSMQEDMEIMREKMEAQAEEAAKLRREAREAAKKTECAKCAAAEEEEEAESSFTDPHRVDPVRLVCKACRKKVATMMMWPCRHLLFCGNCAQDYWFCPVCKEQKMGNVEVLLVPSP